MMLNDLRKLVRVATLLVLAACSGGEQAATPQGPPPVPTDRLTITLTP